VGDRSVITYVAMLRSVNVAGRTIKMAALRELFAALGHADVVTYIQSGNVIFRSPERDGAELAGDITERIGRDLGLDVSVLVRTRDDLSEVVKANPFPSRGADPARLHVTFLAGRVDASSMGKIDPSAFGPDEFHAAGRELYLHCPGGYGTTKLNNAFWERRLKTIATTRNWNTVNKLLQMAHD
jgi:uncharacterized protein (DUF1697 family)